MADEGTFCTTTEAVRKTGAGANSTATGEAYINQFVKEAEGYIMMVIRYDYKTNYGSLNTASKELLREATSNLAAIYAINYDMGGYTSRTEAELMINVLKTIADECLSLLADQKTQTYSLT